jgi:hypothetical protein
MSEYPIVATLKTRNISKQPIQTSLPENLPQIIPGLHRLGVIVGTGPEKTLPVTLAYRLYCILPPQVSTAPCRSFPLQAIVQAFLPIKEVGAEGAAVAP